MIDWIACEIQALKAGWKHEVHSDQARRLKQDLEQGIRWYKETNCASRETWDAYSMNELRHCQEWGFEKCRQRKRKADHKRTLSESLARLDDDHDQCTDIIGDESGDAMIDNIELAKRLKDRLLKEKAFETPWEKVTYMMRFWSGGDVVLLTGLSGTGKTNVALQLTMFNGQRTLYFGLDMSTGGLAKRLWEIEWYRNNQHITFDEKNECYKALYRAAKQDDIKIRDGLKAFPSDSLTVEKIEWITKQEIKIAPVDCIVIDYIGRITSDKDNGKLDGWRIDQAIAHTLKRIAKSCKVRVLALAQYNSKAEKYKKPDQSWTSGSKELIASVDTVLCLWRDKMQSSDQTDESHIWISDDIKNRDAGMHGNVRLECSGLWLTEANQAEEAQW